LLITNINKPNYFIQPILKFGFVYLQEWCSWPAMNDRASLESILRTWIKLVQFLVANPLLFSWIVEVVTVNYLGRKFTVFFFRLNSIFNIFVYLRMSVWHIATFILGWRSIKERVSEQENCLRIPLIQQYASMPSSATCQCPIVIFDFSLYDRRFRPANYRVPLYFQTKAYFKCRLQFVSPRNCK
jgi:hypothetical protein